MAYADAVVVAVAHFAIGRALLAARPSLHVHGRRGGAEGGRPLRAAPRDQSVKPEASPSPARTRTSTRQLTLGRGGKKEAAKWAEAIHAAGELEDG